VKKTTLRFGVVKGKTCAGRGSSRSAKGKNFISMRRAREKLTERAFLQETNNSETNYGGQWGYQRKCKEKITEKQ